jgi:hypothetical protein
MSLSINIIFILFLYKFINCDIPDDGHCTDKDHQCSDPNQSCQREPNSLYYHCKNGKAIQPGQKCNKLYDGCAYGYFCSNNILSPNKYTCVECKREGSFCKFGECCTSDFICDNVCKRIGAA